MDARRRARIDEFASEGAAEPVRPRPSGSSRTEASDSSHAEASGSLTRMPKVLLRPRKSLHGDVDDADDSALVDGSDSGIATSPRRAATEREDDELRMFNDGMMRGQADRRRRHMEVTGAVPRSMRSSMGGPLRRRRDLTARVGVEEGVGAGDRRARYDEEQCTDAFRDRFGDGGERVKGEAGGRATTLVEVGDEDEGAIFADGVRRMAPRQGAARRLQLRGSRLAPRDADDEARAEAIKRQKEIQEATRRL